MMNNLYYKNLESSLDQVLKEVERAKELYPKMFNNQHEAIAVIREEYLELEQEIFKNQKVYDIPAQRKEAIQLAAMCMRLICELT